MNLIYIYKYKINLIINYAAISVNHVINSILDKIGLVINVRSLSLYTKMVAGVKAI